MDDADDTTLQHAALELAAHLDRLVQQVRVMVVTYQSDGTLTALHGHLSAARAVAEAIVMRTPPVLLVEPAPLQLPAPPPAAPPPAPIEAKPPTTTPAAGKSSCGGCGERGHNQRTCPRRRPAAAAPAQVEEKPAEPPAVSDLERRVAVELATTRQATPAEPAEATKPVAEEKVDRRVWLRCTKCDVEVLESEPVQHFREAHNTVLLPRAARMFFKEVSHHLPLEGAPAELGEKFGVSRERVRQLELRALDKLRSLV